MKNILADKLSSLLEKNDMTQRELAELAGVSEVSMSRYVNGDRMPKGTILANIAKALHTTSEDLLGNHLEEDPEMVFYRTQWAISKCADRWSGE